MGLMDFLFGKKALNNAAYGQQGPSATAPQNPAGIDIAGLAQQSAQQKGLLPGESAGIPNFLKRMPPGLIQQVIEQLKGSYPQGQGPRR